MGWADRAEVAPRALLQMDLDGYTGQAALWKHRAAEAMDFLDVRSDVASFLW